ncbi:MAG: arylsulfatase [Verrucomicrobia bacterium]|nr:arylsulfatase [Verrucomicrobiota bacterium]
MNYFPPVLFTALLAPFLSLNAAENAKPAQQPNIIVILADDLGYGDVGCYGATAVKTPNIDRLAQEGLRFTSGYATSATCTPSRYSLLTGEYAFRKSGTGILPGDAAMIIEPGRTTVPALLQKAGYKTAAIGKWHLGLGSKSQPVDWNAEITPGPREVGFDYSFIMAATGDRAPCVYVKNKRVVGLVSEDPISVSYKEAYPGEITGKDNRESLKMDWSEGHNDAVINGVGRIGFMKGGKAALWKDEDMADVFTQEAVDFIEREKAHPFFLYFATHDIHVPRIQANEKLGDHKPGGPLRAGKYSPFEGGTRVPFLTRWLGRIRPGVSDAMVSQVDFLASFAALTGQKPDTAAAPDSSNILSALLGDAKTGRDHMLEYANKVSFRSGPWKFVQPGVYRSQLNRGTNVTVKAPGWLFNLETDLGETDDVAVQHPEVVKEMVAKLDGILGGPIPMQPKKRE